MVNIKRVASAKSQSVRGVSHQPALMGSCLTTSYYEYCGSLVYLVLDELRSYVLLPLMIALMVVLLTFFNMVVWFYL